MKLFKTVMISLVACSTTMFATKKPTVTLKVYMLTQPPYSTTPKNEATQTVLAAIAATQAEQAKKKGRTAMNNKNQDS